MTKWISFYEPLINEKWISFLQSKIKELKQQIATLEKEIEDLREKVSVRDKIISDLKEEHARQVIYTYRIQSNSTHTPMPTIKRFSSTFV